MRYLLNLLMALPRNTLTQEAMSQDDELVEVLIDGRGEGGSSPIRMSEFSPEVETLYGVVDRLGDVVSSLVGLGGKKPPRIAPLKRPQTAWERVAHQRDIDRHRSLVQRVLPNG